VQYEETANVPALNIDFLQPNVARKFNIEAKEDVFLLLFFLLFFLP